MEQQAEFLFANGPNPQLQPDDFRSDFYAEVAAVWSLPVGQAIHIDLREPSMSDLQGRLELARAPDLPLNPRQPLSLRIGTIEFSSQHIVAWTLQ